MESVQVIPGKERRETITQALKVLNEAAETSADEIRAMVEKDYRKFKHVLTDVKPVISDVLSGIQHSTVESFGHAAESLGHAKDKIVTTTRDTAKQIDKSAHKYPWLFVGVAAGLASITGYIFAAKAKR